MKLLLPLSAGRLVGFVIRVGLLVATAATAETTLDPDHHFAYAANAGWVDGRGDGGTNGLVVSEYVLSGFAYAANLGWIHFGDGLPKDGIRYSNTSADDCGVNCQEDGRLRGFAWGANIGWIHFGDIGDPRADWLTGAFSGYAWGANVGWISLNNASAMIRTHTVQPGRDKDGDGITDAYELIHAGDIDVMNSETDQDGDGQTDAEEDMAGTNPFDPMSRLRITEITVNSSRERARLTWTSEFNRLYRLQISEGADITAWEDYSGGLQQSDGSLTTRTLEVAPSSSRFFRVQALKPLQP